MACHRSSVFANEDLEFQRMADLEKENIDIIFEYTAVKSTKLQLKIINVYRSPVGCVNTFFEKLESVLEQVCRQYNKYKIAITGDFNINFLDKAHTKRTAIINLLGSYNLNQAIHGATRVIHDVSPYKEATK